MKTTGVPGVYVIINNIDSRVYIGSASNLAMRKGSHYFALRKGRHYNKPLQKFIDGNGMDSIVFAVLERCPVDKLKEREQYYFSVYPDKFNIATRSDSTFGLKHSQESKDKMSKSRLAAKLKGIPKSEETKRRMRKPKAKEHARRIKEAQKAKYKVVYQYDFSLELIAKHESISHAAKETGFGRRDISACCNDNQNTTGGYVFAFWEIDSLISDSYRRKIARTQNYKNRYSRKPILQTY